MSGFTGRHLATRLASDGWEIFGLGAHADDLSFPNLNVDMSETSAIAGWLTETAPTHIVHLAAQSHVIGDPLKFFKVNVLGTESLLLAISEARIVPKKLLIASSANVYGQCENSPIKEEEPSRPVNHYALSKAAMELLVQKWFGQFPTIITRPFNYTGPGQSEAFLFPKIVGAFHRNDPVMTLGNLKVARDLSDIDFVVEAYRRLLLSPIDSEVFNICSGSSISIETTLQLVSELTQYLPEVVVDPALVRPDEIAELRGDSARLQSAIGPLEPCPPKAIFAAMLTALDRQTP